jgi:hypothetical protein
MAKTYAEKIKDAEVMSSGLQNNAERLAKRGLDEAFTKNLSSDLQSAIALNNEQEKLKADLKQKTAELDAKLTALNAQVSEARKIVKIEFPKEQWKEFGIADKR